MKRLLLSIVALAASLSSFAVTYPYQDGSLTPEQRLKCIQFRKGELSLSDYNENTEPEDLKRIVLRVK